MRIFERTFVITRVLYWLTAGVAAIGLVSGRCLRGSWSGRVSSLSCGRWVSHREAGGLIEAQTGFMGFVAFLAAIPAGVADGGAADHGDQSTRIRVAD